MKTQYYQAQFQKYRNNPRKFWQIINEATDANMNQNSSISDYI